MTNRSRFLTLGVAAGALVVVLLGMPRSAEPAHLTERPDCDAVDHQRRVEVDSVARLRAALEEAIPGDLIVVAEGEYRGTFELTIDAEPDRRITLCAPHLAVIDGETMEAGYGLHLTADHWTVMGLAIRNVNKGIVLDGATYADLAYLEISQLGQEGVHFRTHSSHNVLRGSWIHDTGKLVAQFGEGVYIGSAESNWCRYTECGPDRSNANEVIDNAIGPNVTAESIDVKEGTSRGIIRGNTFDGTGMEAADSWVDVKGDDYLIADNTGRHSRNHGFQVHEKVGYGHRTTFAGNRLEVDAPGFGFEVDADAEGTVVSCDNQVREAGSGWGNVPCSRDT